MKNSVSISWWLGIISFLTRRTGVRCVWVLSFAVCFSTVSAAPIDSCRICVLYKYYIATKNREHKNVTDSVLSILEVGDSVTKYGDLTRYTYAKRNVPQAMKSIMVDMFNPNINAYTFVFLQYHRHEVMRIREFLHPAYFVYEEPVPAEWSLEPGTTTVMGYKCRKARLLYGGREWVAWYAPDLPVSSGPWKLCGLPGLILKAEDLTLTHRFEAYSLFRIQQQTIADEHNASDKVAGRNEFIAHRNKIKLDERYMTQPYFHDQVNAQFVLRPQEFYEKHGPHLTINGVAYPTRYSKDGENGLMRYMFNYFQPLELK